MLPIFFAAVCLAQPSLDILRLDILASRAGVRTLRSQDIARIESGGTSATFAIVSMEDTTEKIQAHGMRVILAAPDANAVLYIDKAMLPAIKEKLDGMAKIAARFLAKGSGNGMISSVCPGDEGKLPLAFGYHFPSSGQPLLTVTGPGLPVFAFNRPTPAEVADIFAEAIVRLHTD